MYLKNKRKREMRNISGRRKYPSSEPSSNDGFEQLKPLFREGGRESADAEEKE